MQNNNQGLIVVVIAVAIGGGVWWYHDSQKPENKIQGTWGLVMDGNSLTMSFQRGRLGVSFANAEGRVSVNGDYRFLNDTTLTTSFSSASVSDGTDRVSVGGLPIHAGRLTVVELTGKSLVLRDETGSTLRLYKR